jgi:hypothetical protein
VKIIAINLQNLNRLHLLDGIELRKVLLANNSDPKLDLMQQHSIRMKEAVEILNDFGIDVDNRTLMRISEDGIVLAGFDDYGSLDKIYG